MTVEGDIIAVPPEDNNLRFIEQFEHRQHVVKIGRRGDQIRLLVYPPHTMLATHMFVDELANYEDAIKKAKAFIDGRPR
jgi:hypothetical protein